MKFIAILLLALFTIDILQFLWEHAPIVAVAIILLTAAILGTYHAMKIFNPFAKSETNIVELRDQVKEVATQVVTVGVKLGSVDTKVDGAIENIARIEQRMEKNFQIQEQRFDQKLDKLEKKFEEKFDEVALKFEKIDQRFEKIDLRFEKLDQKIDKKFDTIIEILLTGKDESTSPIRKSQ